MSDKQLTHYDSRLPGDIKLYGWNGGDTCRINLTISVVYESNRANLCIMNASGTMYVIPTSRITPKAMQVAPTDPRKPSLFRSGIAVFRQ